MEPQVTFACQGGEGKRLSLRVIIEPYSVKERRLCMWRGGEEGEHVSFMSS